MEGFARLRLQKNDAAAERAAFYHEWQGKKQVFCVALNHGEGAAR
jgi:hypothetical protein